MKYLKVFVSLLLVVLLVGACTDTGGGEDTTDQAQDQGDDESNPEGRTIKIAFQRAGRRPRMARCDHEQRKRRGKELG